jgi:hypothetical protein
MCGDGKEAYRPLETKKEEKEKREMTDKEYMGFVRDNFR